MRTLKKVLALSLVFAMAFTLMAGAAFKDQDTIDSSLNDDIQLMTALGVFQGDENGNFNPAQSVTRAQAAKMIYVLKNNGVDDGAVAFQGVSKYADVTTGFWGEGYINYCTNLGYMNGWKEGNVQKFDPNGNVTGIELAKMLLCMIGYKSDIQGYTGNNWKLNVQQDASEAGIFQNFEPSIYAATPRQWTARMLVNAINATYVTYTKGELVYGMSQNGAEVSYATKYLKLETVVGTLVQTPTNKLASTSSASLLGTKGTEMKIANIDKDNSSDATSHPTTFEYAVSNDLLGQQVKVFYKATSSSTDTSKNKVYSVLPFTKEQKVVNVTLGDISYDDKYVADKTKDAKDVGNSDGDGGKVTVPGLDTVSYSESKAQAPVLVYINNVLVESKENGNTSAEQVLVDGTKATIKAFSMNSLKGVLFGINNNTPVKLVADDDGYIKYAFINDTTSVARVTKVDTAKGVLTVEKAGMLAYTGDKLFQDKNGDEVKFTSTSSDKENMAKYLNFVDTVEKDDIILAKKNVSTGEVKYDISKAPVVSGSVSSYTLNSKGDTYSKLTINGDAYKKAAVVLNGYDWATTGSAGNDKTFYTDGKYVVYSDGGTASASASNLAYIIGTAHSDAYGESNWRVKVLLSDGTTGTYDVNATYSDTTDLNSKDTTAKKDAFMADIQHKVVSYSMSNGKITLKAIKTEAEAGTKLTFQANDSNAIAYDKKSNTVKVNGKTYRTSDNSYFFLVTGVSGNDYSNAKYSVVKASEMSGDVTGLADYALPYAVQEINGFPTMAYATLTTTEKSISSDTSPYVFVTSNASVEEQSDGTYRVNFSAIAKGETEEKTYTIKADSKSEADSAAKTVANVKGKVATYKTADGYVDQAELTAVKVETTGYDAANTWYLGQVKAWNDSQALIKGMDGTSTLYNVAKDVNVYSVDASGDNCKLDGYEVTEALDTLASDKGNAIFSMKKVDSVWTITDIFVESNGESIEKIK